MKLYLQRKLMQITAKLAASKDYIMNETTKCTFPPEGWYCTRGAGHPGPCAAHPTDQVVYQMALEQWGYAAQANQAQEELGELIVAISKHFFRGKGIEDSGIVGELADVSIMVDQLVHMLGVSAEVEAARKFKMDRLLNRILDQRAKAQEAQ